MSTQPTRQEIETALDAGHLWVAITNGKWWVARRNGATQRWKRDEARFRIPFKYGLKNYGALTDEEATHFGKYFRISEGAPK